MLAGKYQIRTPEGRLAQASSEDSLGFTPLTPEEAAPVYTQPPQAFIFILMRSEGALTSSSSELSFTLNRALQETDALRLQCWCD